MKARVFYSWLLMVWTLSPVNTFDPFTIALVAGAGATLGPLTWATWNHFYEKCDSKWINLNERGENVWVLCGKNAKNLCSKLKAVRHFEKV